MFAAKDCISAPLIPLPISNGPSRAGQRTVKMLCQMLSDWLSFGNLPYVQPRRSVTHRLKVSLGFYTPTLASEGVSYTPRRFVVCRRRGERIRERRLADEAKEEKERERERERVEHGIYRSLEYYYLRSSKGTHQSRTSNKFRLRPSR